MTLPGFPKGMRYRMLSVDGDSGACSLKVRYEPGFRLPGGLSYAEMELFVLSGAIEVGGEHHGPGSYFFVPAGVVLPALSAPRGAQLLQYYNHGEPSFVASDSDHPQAERDRIVVVNAYEDLEWGPPQARPAVAPGCLIKLLRRDPDSGAATFLYSLVPNFRQDNVSFHDCAEESYQISGTTWTMQFGDLAAGGYSWRPPNVNHGAFASRHGALALGRTDGELHNYFHFDPWTTPDENRRAAAQHLRQRRPALYATVASRAAPPRSRRRD